MRRLLLICALALVACDAPTNVANEAAPTAIEALAPADIDAFFDCLRENGRTIVAAHRGGPAPGFAENAIPTFENTVNQAPALLEIDIARTRDNVLVLMHDDELDRTTTGTGLVRDHTLAEIQALQLEDENGQALDARAPTFREALDWARGRAILELDVKRGVSYEDVIAEVRAAGAEDRVVFITYSDDAAVRVHNLAPELMLSVSIDEASDLGALERRGVDLTKVLAWTGTDEPNSALNIALAQRGVEAMFGTLGNPERSWDGRFAREGQEQYAAIAETGLQLIATDRPIEASRDLDANDGVDGFAAMQCATGD
ncbi:MAG: glycerophosphodiester phosphodiesterase family protein [Hyphomonadaceae bacterium JAD_PAG50586_4]|nr:MAG: glycerophosphodiester phosphodiesterase family protein [Hyphomonadaceae bacterium JAD_PAG50586_4]